MGKTLWANGDFERANESYQRGDYTEAITLYKNSLQTSHSPQQYYNLGNAYFQLKDYAQAILQYKRALFLEPGNERIEAHLVRSQLALSIQPQHPNLLEQWASLFSVHTWFAMAAVAIWIVIISIAIPRVFKGWNLPIFQGTLYPAGMVLVASLLGLGYAHSQRNLGIILTHETELKVAPSPSSPHHGHLNSGTLVYYDKSFNDFAFIATADKREGWVKKENFEKILN